jgi:metallo-beta-lactamase class B
MKPTNIGFRPYLYLVVLRFFFLGLGFCLDAICWSQACAQITIIVDSVPTYTPPGATVYLAGTMNNWNPGSAAHQLMLQADSSRRITLPAVSGTLSFKFTRGSWASVEGNASGAFRPNRTHTLTNGDTLRLKILSWEDLHSGGGGGGGTANAQVQILSDTFWMPALNRYRRIWLYLPVGYTSSAPRRYPVIYMHDGQNLFNAATSFAGEWEVDECLTRLHSSGDPGAIVVGIDNGGSQRINEYSPWINPQYGGGQGDAYLQFIVQTLKPYMDSHYRTDSTRDGTWIWGSSMGGLISQYGAVKYQEVFSRVGVFSPSLWFDSRIMQQPLQEGYRLPMRFYLMAGALESSSMVPQLYQLRDQLLLAGFPSSQIQTVIKADGQHSEWFWRREFQDAYQWLHQSQPAAHENLEGLGPESHVMLLFPNPTCGLIKVKLPEKGPAGRFRGLLGLDDAMQNLSYSVLDTRGLVVMEALLPEAQEIDLGQLSSGIYRFFLKTSSGTHSETIHIVQ